MITLRSTRRRRTQAVTLLAVLALVTACGAPRSGNTAGEAAADYPSKDLEFLVPYGSSSGADAMVRTIADILKVEDKYPNAIVIKNVEGGSGAAGYSQFAQRKGDPYVLAPTVSSTITTPILADTDWNITDFVPVALMGRDDYVIAVKKDSSHRTLADLVTEAKANKMSFGGTSKVSAAFILDQRLSQAGGFTTNFVPFEETGELTTALLSDSLNAIITNPGEIAGQLRSGDIRALAFSGPVRLPELPEVPTLKESGYEIEAFTPRGIVLPPDTEDSVRQYWIENMEFVAGTEAWQDYLKTNYVTPYQLFGDDFEKALVELQSEYEEVLGNVGVG